MNMELTDNDRQRIEQEDLPGGQRELNNYENEKVIFNLIRICDW